MPEGFSAAACGLPGQRCALRDTTSLLPHPIHSSPETVAAFPKGVPALPPPQNETKIEDNDMEMHILRTWRQPPGMQPTLLVLRIVTNGEFVKITRSTQR